MNEANMCCQNRVTISRRFWCTSAIAIQHRLINRKINMVMNFHDGSIKISICHNQNEHKEWHFHYKSRSYYFHLIMVELPSWCPQFWVIHFDSNSSFFEYFLDWIYRFQNSSLLITLFPYRYYYDLNQRGTLLDCTVACMVKINTSTRNKEGKTRLIR